MQKKPAAIVLVALLIIFGYYTWEYFSKKHIATEERERDNKKNGEGTKEPNSHSVVV